jgi:hypothetical protein
MEASHVKDDRSLRVWLRDKPIDWAQSIALRAALRALPYISISDESWLKNFAILPFGAAVTSWMQLTDESIFVGTDGSRADARFGGRTFDFAGYEAKQIAALAADSSYHSADAQSKSNHASNDCVYARQPKPSAEFSNNVPQMTTILSQREMNVYGSVSKAIVIG